MEMKLTPAHPDHKGTSPRGQLLRALRDLGTASRTDLVQHTGMQPSTVSTLTGDLLRTGVLEEVASREASPRGGRRQILLAVAGGRPAAVGLHVGVRYLSSTVIDARGTPLHTARVERPGGGTPAEVVELAAEHVDRLLTGTPGAPAGDPAAGILGLGVTVPAPVDRTSGRVLANRSLDWPGGVDLGRALSDRLGVAVSVDSSPYGQLLAERSFGSLQGVDDALLINVATTVRFAVLKNGRLHTPSPHFAGDIGHVPTGSRARTCFCGAVGCLNAVAGYDALSAQAGQLLGRELDVRRLDELAAAGDEPARKLFRAAGRRISEALVPFLLVYEPSRVVIACPVAASASALHTELQRCIQRHAARLGDHSPDITAASVADNMAIGAAWLPVERALYS